MPCASSEAHICIESAGTAQPLVAPGNAPTIAGRGRFACTVRTISARCPPAGILEGVDAHTTALAVHVEGRCGVCSVRVQYGPCTAWIDRADGGVMQTNADIFPAGEVRKVEIDARDARVRSAWGFPLCMGASTRVSLFHEVTGLP